MLHPWGRLDGALSIQVYIYIIGVPAQAGGLELGSLCLFQPTPFYDSMIKSLLYKLIRTWMLYLGKVSLDYNGRGTEEKEVITCCKDTRASNSLYIVKTQTMKEYVHFLKQGGRRVVYNNDLCSQKPKHSHDSQL